MNKIISILICCFIAGCLFVSCEQPDIPDVPNYDKTEILTFKVYNQDKEEVGTPVILSDEGVVTITVDGKQINNCGSTVIFAEEGLEPDVDFQVQDIHSTTDGSLGENPIIAKTVNSYKNAFGKPVVVVIQSQLGDPICAYSGENVYWEVCQNLPKTTKLMIDGRALYIHRANFQTIDKALLD